jgi:hypothetical protein
MKLSKKTRSRLLLINVALWFVSGITVLGFLGGPRGVVERYVQPVQDELGGWLDLALSAAGWNRISTSSYALTIEPEVFRAAALLARDAITDARASDDGREGLSAFLEKRKPRWLS